MELNCTSFKRLKGHNWITLLWQFFDVAVNGDGTIVTLGAAEAKFGIAESGFGTLSSESSTGNWAGILSP